MNGTTAQYMVEAVVHDADNEKSIRSFVIDDVEGEIDELGDVLTGNQSEMGDSTNLFVSLYADQSVPYKAIVDVLNVANDNHFKMVLATRPPKSAPGVADEPAAQSDNTISPENTSDQVPTE